MKVLLVGPASSIHLARWANSLAETHEIHIATLHPAGEQRYEDGVRIHLLGSPGLPNYFRCAPRLARLATRLDPDLVHAHYATGYGTLARLGCRRLRVPKILSVWGSDVYTAPNSRFMRHLVIKNLRAADVVTSSSRAMARQAATLSALKKVAITPFGVDTDFFVPGVPKPDAKELVIGTVRSLDWSYGIDTLLSSYALLLGRISRDTRLVIHGGGPDRAALERQASDLGIAARVSFTGAIPHHEVPGALHNLDIYVALSRSESFGVSILEAGAAGLPVVVSNADGPAEVTVAGETGLVVGIDQPEQAAAALKELVCDDERRTAMGRAGRAHVVAEYSWQRSVEIMNNLYSELVPGRV